MIRHRFATAADIDTFYGERPSQTIRAIVIEMDEKPVAIIGLAQERERLQAFSEYRPELEPHLKSMGVLRAIKTAQRMIASAPILVYALCEKDNGLLSRLGFTKSQTHGVYLWLN